MENESPTRLLDVPRKHTSICKEIVERHGGRIWLEPTAGPGALFRFTVPKHPRHQPIGDAVFTQS
ncbi:MAG: hypothetical protein HYZ57_12515 [Acidobacteria bacterium]|nr:hypothetical protein [Acidobacteriota bacterium]MBI3280653.1 hypothetical protein [Acidobacteriota bacterium]